MNRIARAACAAAVSVALLSTAPVVSAGATTAPEARKATTYKVIAKLTKADVVAGEDTVKVKGRVKPKAAGQKVTLQQRREGRKKWVKSGTAKIKKNGTFVLKDKPSVAGVRYYRVLKPAAGGIKAGKSKELKLNVWGWDKLAYRLTGANAGVVTNVYTQFGTEGYPYSLVQQTSGTPGYVEYTLGKKCRTLRATYALTDDSATGASGAVTVSVDGVAKSTHALATGTIVADHEIDVTNAFRIRFDMNATPTPAGKAAVGSPEVLCLD
jgi:hypothetical protein